MNDNTAQHGYNRKHLVVFFIAAYLISWVVWLPLYAHIFGLSSLPVIPYNHAIGGLGPMIASLFTTAVFFKADGVKKLLIRCVSIRTPIYLLIAIISPFALVMIASLISCLINDTAFNISGLFTPKEFPAWNFLVFLLYNIIFFGLGEEVGWRGFALPRLLTKFSPLKASIVITVLWALWHWPLFFYRSGYTAMDWTGILGWIFSLLTGSVLMTWLYIGSKGSVLACAVFHATIDVAFTADLSDKNVGNYMGFLITVWGILTIIVFRSKYLHKPRPLEQSTENGKSLARS